jgi:putative membrane protein
VLALPLIIVTLGVAYFFVSMLMLLVTEWVSPDLVIDGFWPHVGATIVVGLVNWLGSMVAGRR